MAKPFDVATKQLVESDPLAWLWSDQPTTAQRIQLERTDRRQLRLYGASAENMSKPFDATLKELVEKYPTDWLAQLGLPTTARVDLIDADLSTVTTQSDKVIRVQEPTPWLFHVEMQADEDETLVRRMLKYVGLLHERHNLPVHSVAVLLRPQADHDNLTGFLHVQPPHGGTEINFRYQVVRVWQEPVESLLAGGPGVLPLAPISDVARKQLPRIIRQVDTRLFGELETHEAQTLLASTYILMGLRHTPGVVAQLFQGVGKMRESSTYRAILEEGRVEGREEGRVKGRAEGRADEAKRLLLLQGDIRFGRPNTSVRRTIEGINSINELERLSRRLLNVSSWEELLEAN